MIESYYTEIGRLCVQIDATKRARMDARAVGGRCAILAAALKNGSIGIRTTCLDRRIMNGNWQWNDEVPTRPQADPRRTCCADCAQAIATYLGAVKDSRRLTRRLNKLLESARGMK